MPRFISGHFWHDLWVGFFTFVLIVGIFSTQPLIVAFGIMGLAAALLSAGWNKLSLENLIYERTIPTRNTFVGRELSITLSLTNKKPIPLPWVNVNDEVSSELQVIGDDHKGIFRHSLSLGWYEKVHWDYNVLCKKRGLQKIGPAYLESGDPFGFLNTRMLGPPEEKIIVYPEILPFTELGMPTAMPLGDINSNGWIHQDPSKYVAVREYARGDLYRSIDWKTSAKISRLTVRQFEPTHSATIILATAIDTTNPHWAAYSPKLLERVIVAAASIAGYTNEKKFRVGLISNDTPINPKPIIPVPPSSDPLQLKKILTSIATIKPYSVAPMYRYLSEFLSLFPYGSTIVLITSFLPREYGEVIYEAKQRGYKVVVIYVGEDSYANIPEGVILHDLSLKMDSLGL